MTIKCSLRPLFRQYDGNLQPQDAYLEIEKGNVSVDYQGDNNCMPADVFNGERFWIGIDRDLTQYEIDDLIEKVTPMARAMWDSADGVQFVHGSYTLVHTDISREILAKIERICECTHTNAFDTTCDDADCEYCQQN